MNVLDRLRVRLDEGVVGFPTALASSVGVIMASPVILTVTTGFGLGGGTFAAAMAIALIMMLAQAITFAEAMSILPDNAVAELGADDVRTYGVVRVADEFVTDLMKAACGIEYETAAKDAVPMTIGDVAVPFASPRTLWLTKRTYREKDALDRNFLAELLRQRGESVPEADGGRKSTDADRGFEGQD